MDNGNQIDFPLQSREDYINEINSGDYENLLQTMNKYFGDILVMYR